MIVRGLDSEHDWIYGKGINDYKTDIDALTQMLETRLLSFLGDCFFDVGAGVDWFNLLGSKNKIALNLAISAVILNTENVTELQQLSINLNINRELTISYKVKTTFGLVIRADVAAPTNFLLDEFGSIITTEDGTPIITEQGGA